MSIGDIEGIKTKLFALNMRVAEVRNEVAAAQAKATRLEKQLEDARLAALLGESAGDPAEKVETFTVQPKFEGNALDFGMVIPTPGMPKLHEMPKDFFKHLAVFRSA